MSVGNTPRSRNPSRNENLGLAVSSLPIHFGGFGGLALEEGVERRGTTSSTRTTMSSVSSDAPASEAPRPTRYAIVLGSVDAEDLEFFFTPAE